MVLLSVNPPSVSANLISEIDEELIYEIKYPLTDIELYLGIHKRQLR
jgi:hypothetical protein